jgi:hypothetical protein
MIQRVAKWMTEHGHPWPDLRLSAHSTRIGAAHDMVAAGIDLTSIMHAGGRNDPKMFRYYTRELAAHDSNMARMVRAQPNSCPEGHRLRPSAALVRAFRSAHRSSSSPNDRYQHRPGSIPPRPRCSPNACG